MSNSTPNILVPPAAQLIPRDFEGYIFISDIDRTYLATQIDSLGGLLRAALETAERKANVPGFSIILRAVRRGAGAEPAANPLFFVSASPPQMEVKLLRKMELDGVEHDGIIFKNQLEHVRKADFKKLREQIAYKLGALLSLWQMLPPKAQLVLFGDDSESDAVVYSLFSDIVSGRISGRDLIELLIFLRVDRNEARKVAWFARQFSNPVQPVKAAFINLATGSQPTYYTRFGNFLYPTENSFQAALALFELGLIREQAVRSVAKKLVFEHDFDADQLVQSVENGARRGLYSLESFDKLWPQLHQAGILGEPITRPHNEGAVIKLNPQRWNESTRLSLRELKLRYSEEGRY